MLKVETVTKQYETPRGGLSILEDVSFAKKAGEALCIMGASGSGKSTLLQIVGTLEPPTSGRVTLGDRDPFALAEPDLAAFRNREIGFVFQEHFLLPQCSVLENVLAPTLVASGSANHEARARDLLARVGLGDRLDHRPAELSGGQGQRVAIARALVANPSVLVADEPTGDLDRNSADQILELLGRLTSEQGKTIVMVTHDARAAEAAGRILHLEKGQLVESPEEVAAV